MLYEGREGEERLMSATVKQRKTGVGKCCLRPKKDHFTPANEIACGFVWDKLYPPIL
jgi:hypothetical protein